MYPTVLGAKPTHLFIVCSDIRLPAQERFIRGRFGVSKDNGTAVIIHVLGGAGPLARKEQDHSGYEYLQQQILFALRHNPTITTVGPINHQACLWYGGNGVAGEEETDLPVISRNIVTFTTGDPTVRQKVIVRPSFLEFNEGGNRFSGREVTIPMA